MVLISRRSASVFGHWSLVKFIPGCMGGANWFGVLHLVLVQQVSGITVETELNCSIVQAGHSHAQVLAGPVSGRRGQREFLSQSFSEGGQVVSVVAADADVVHMNAES